MWASGDLEKRVPDSYDSYDSISERSGDHRSQDQEIIGVRVPEIADLGVLKCCPGLADSYDLFFKKRQMLSRLR